MLEVLERLLLEMGEQVVAQVVLDVARDADDRLPHPELEHPRRQRDPEQGDGVAAELLGGDAAVEIVHGEAQHLRLGERDEVGERDARESPCEPAPVAGDRGEEACEQVADGFPPRDYFAVLPSRPWFRFSLLCLKASAT